MQGRSALACSLGYLLDETDGSQFDGGAGPLLTF